MHISRDLFDAHDLLVRGIPETPLDNDPLKIAFVVYGAINREDWRTVGVDMLDKTTVDMRHYLLPFLRIGNIGESFAPHDADLRRFLLASSIDIPKF
jgi:hypothetical protein